MQTRSGKTYSTAASSCFMEKNNHTNVNNRPINILTGQMKISNELAKFLGKPPGSNMARTDVARCINSYITTNKLQDRQNGRIINADEKLSKLLKLGRNDVLTYFNLQNYLKPHFTRQ